jgi:general stress protein CsbA
MFQHNYEPGFWSKLADYLPIIISIVLVAGAIFTGVNQGFWGIFLCIVNITTIIVIVALYLRYRSEEKDFDAGKKGKF